MTAPRLDPAAAPWRRVNRPLVGALALLALAAPWAGVRPHLLITFLVWAVVAQCWNLVLGVSGIYSFAQLALFAVGGFATGTLSMEFGWSPWASLWTAPVAAVVAALLIGLPALRLRGVYVVLLTLAFHELFRNFVATGPQRISHGGHGLRDVPRLGFDRLVGPQQELVPYYYMALALFVLATASIGFLLRSPVGLAFRALRDSETYAVCRGVDPFRHKLFLFAFSAFFTGLAGGFWTHYQGAISPSMLNFGIMINLLAMIVIGGWGTFWGPIAGAAVLTALPEWLYGVERYRPLALGVALAALAVLCPQGLLPLAARWWANLRRIFRTA